MEGSLLQYLVKWLVIEQKYQLLIQEGTPLTIRQDYNCLMKDDGKIVRCLYIIDGNKQSLGFIQDLLTGQNRLFESLTEQGKKYLAYLVVVFEEGAEAEKLEYIKAWQEETLTDRRCLKCFIVDGKDQKSEKLFSRAITDSGLGRLIQDFMAKKDKLSWLSRSIEELIEEENKKYHLDIKVERTMITYMLLAINILVFVGLMAYSLLSGRSYDELLILSGAKINSYIIQGQYWRLFTPIFLHGGILHLLVNCYSLYILGSLVERLFGRGKFIVSYLVAGIVGNLLSFMFVEGYSVGASGAIFGLMGMLLYYGIENPAQFKHYFGKSVLSTIMINLIYGMSIPGIDNCAHLGGLIGGFLAVGAISKANIKKWYTNRMLYAAVLIGVSIGALTYGLTSSQSQITRKLVELERLEEREDWEKLELKGKELYELMPKREDDKISLLWSLTKAEVMLGDYDEAIRYGQELTKLSPINGHYLLGINYYEHGQYSEAKKELQLAFEAGNEAAGQMFELIQQYEANVQ